MAVISAALIVLAAATAAPAPSAEPAPWWTRVPDVYDGQIFSGRGYAAGTTEFRRPTPGAGAGLEGSYAFTDADGTKIAGALSGCAAPTEGNLVCRWRDRYGEGRAVFFFEPDLTGFTGLWFSAEVPKQGMPWTGARRKSE